MREMKLGSNYKMLDGWRGSDDHKSLIHNGKKMVWCTDMTFKKLPLIERWYVNDYQELINVKYLNNGRVTYRLNINME